VTVFDALARWPALQGLTADLPAGLPGGLGVWGKAHGAASDFHWLSSTFEAAPEAQGIERELVLGSEDAPQPGVFWRSLGEWHYAGAFHRSTAVDAAGRQGFLEKLVIQWRRPSSIPAVLAALALLPHVERAMRDRHGGQFRSDDMLPGPEPSVHAETAWVALDLTQIEAAVERGCQDIAERLDEDRLAELYVALLAGATSWPVRSPEPWPAEAVAALLLPLPAATAADLSVAGWLPSLAVDAGIGRRWQAVVASPSLTLPACSFEPAPEQREEGLRLARALRACDPDSLRGAPAAAPRPVPRRDGDEHAPLRLCVWGPAQAGKTAAMAQIYHDLKAGQGEWNVLPTRDGDDFIERMSIALIDRRTFPGATNIGHVGKVAYRLRHRDGRRQALIEMEDRAGVDYVKLEPEARQSLAGADGLVLLFDPDRPRGALEMDVQRTLRQVHLERNGDGRRDERPVAVCVSKADLLIDSVQDLELARHEPERFVRERFVHAETLIDLLERFCARYRLFPTSAAGVRVRAGLVEPAVFLDEDLTPRLLPGGRTLNLLEPFVWLIEQLRESRA
jgi:hypothetical protein